MCNFDAPCFGHVGGPSGGPICAPPLMGHRLPFLHLIIVGVDRVLRRWLSILVVKYMRVLMFRCTMYTNGAPCFDNVGASFGGTPLAPTLVDNTRSFLQLVTVGVVGCVWVMAILVGNVRGFVDLALHHVHT